MALEKEKTTTEEIFDNLVDTFEKLKLEELKEIFKRHSHQSDEDMLDLLIEWNTNYQQKDEDEEKHFIYKIDIGGKIFSVSKLEFIEMETRFDYSRNKEKFLLLINRSENNQTPYKDTEIQFPSKELLEKEFEGLKTKLYQFNVRFV